MPELDQLSEIIGTLRAEVKENQRQHSASFKKLDSIEEKINKLAGAVELVINRMDTMEKKIMTEIDPAITDYRAMKNKGLGVIAFIGLVASGTGATLAKWLSSQ